MSKNKKIQDLFAEQDSNLDFKTLREGHENRFLKKLNQDAEEPAVVVQKSNWKTKAYLAIAASVILCCFLFFMKGKEEAITEKPKENVYTEVTNAEFYFNGIIETEISKLTSSKNEHTSKLVEDTLSRLKDLEEEYGVLQAQLVENYDRRIIKAMISNFQTRIDLLNDVLERIEIIKKVKKRTA